MVEKSEIEMKKMLFSLLVPAFLLVTVDNLLCNSTFGQSLSARTEIDEKIPDLNDLSEGAIVFDMKYRGLGGGKDELRYNSYWGYGGRDNETPFIKYLKKDVKELANVYNRFFKGAELAAVEINNNKVVAFYFDLNADGKVSEDEKILPINVEESSNRTTTEFVTPDFIVNTSDGLKVPFRVLLQARVYNQSSRPSCMWSPSCILEGASTLDGEPSRLILYTSGFSGSFSEFGRCSYSLNKVQESSGRYMSRQTLSSIINYDGQFYHMDLYGRHTDNSTIRAVLKKYTGDTGELVVVLNTGSKIKSSLSGANIAGSKDKTIYFYIPGNQSILPVGTYKLSRGNINYNLEKDDQWRLDFKEGPEFTIDSDMTCSVDLGRPELSIKAVDEDKRYQSDVKEQTVYSRGTKVYITRVVKGKAGELYGRFSQRQNNSDSYKDIQPEIKIVNSDGKEIVSEKMKYG